MAELRWNPILREWNIVADERQDRPVLPEDSCPLCPGVLEIPARDYYIVSFENRFPALRRKPGAPNLGGDDFYRVRENKGICEVLLYTPNHELDPANLSLKRFEDLIAVGADRHKFLSRKEYIKYVYIFENRGITIGVSLTHPHGQIYAFPFIPPVIKDELKSAKQYHSEKSACLFCKVIESEKGFDKRIIYENQFFLAFVPFYARFPYEVHLYPKQHIPDILSVRESEYHALAEIIKVVLTKYRGLFPKEEFPYMMVFHQAPTDGKDYSFYHFHIEFYSLKRGEGKIKYRAGVETGAGTFISSLSPEKMAADLDRIKVKFE